MMLIRLVINLVVVSIIIDRLYYPKSKRRDFYFTFMIISVAIFFLVFFMIFVLEDLKTKTSIGLGIGLFGIFSIMRYRTDTMPVREMTYLFVIISLSVVNAIAASVTIVELLLTNALFILAIWICERCLKPAHVKLIQYDRIELVRPECRDALKQDLEQRLGLHIRRIDIGGIDLLRDMAVLRVTYDSDEPDNPVDKIVKVTNSQLTE